MPAAKSTKKPAVERTSIGDWFRIPLFGRLLPLYWTWILLGVFLVVLHLGVRLQLKAMTYDFLSAFGDVASGDFRNVEYSFGGTLEADDITLTPHESDGTDNTIHVGRIVVETPGSFWLLRAAMPNFSPKASGTLGKLQNAAEKLGRSEDPPNEFPPTDELTVRFEDVDWGDYGMHYLIPSIDWVGGTSGALFEAEGCSNDWWWTRDEVRERFGAPNADGGIELQFKVTGPNTLASTVTFGHGGNSELRIEREFVLAGEADDFLDSEDDWRTTKLRWVVEDHGFVKARNRWCAKEAKLTEAQFVDRHVAAVRRMVQSIGFEPKPDVLDAYRAFAQNGGTLTWETNLPPGKAIEDAEGHGAEAELLAMNARLTVKGRAPVSYVGTFMAPREFPDDAESVVAVLRREGALPAIEVPVPGATAAAAQAATAALIAAPLSAEPSSVPVATTTQAATPTPAPAAVATTAPTNVVVDPLTDADFAAAAEAEEPAAPAAGPFDPKDLAAHVGHGVQIKLANGRRYYGTVERVDARSVSIKIGGRSGNSASLSFLRENIASAESLGW